MPIVVDHTPSGLTSVIAAGLAAAENQRKAELADKLGLETRRLDIAQQGQVLDQRRFEAQQADIPMARQHAADMVNLQYDRLGQRDEQQSQLRVQEAQQRADAMLSPMQQSQLKKLDEQELMVNSTPTLMPAAKEMMLAQIDQKRHTIRNQKGGSRPSPFPEGRDVGDVWEDASGAVFSRDKDGNVKLLVRPDQRKGAAADDRKNPETFRKRYDAVTKRLTSTNPETGLATAPTREQVLAALREEDDAFSKYAGTPATGESSFIGPLPPASAATPQAAVAKAADDALMQSVQSTVPAGFDTKKVYSNGNISIVGEHILKAAINHARKTGQVVPIADFMRDVLKIPVSSLGPAGAASPRAGVLKLSPHQIKSKGSHPTVATAGAEYAKRPESPGRNQTAKYGNISEW